MAIISYLRSNESIGSLGSRSSLLYHVSQYLLQPIIELKDDDYTPSPVKRSFVVHVALLNVLRDKYDSRPSSVDTVVQRFGRGELATSMLTYL